MLHGETGHYGMGEERDFELPLAGCAPPSPQWQQWNSSRSQQCCMTTPGTVRQFQRPCRTRPPQTPLHEFERASESWNSWSENATLTHATISRRPCVEFQPAWRQGLYAGIVSCASTAAHLGMDMNIKLQHNIIADTVRPGGPLPKGGKHQTRETDSTDKDKTNT